MRNLKNLNENSKLYFSFGKLLKYGLITKSHNSFQLETKYKSASLFSRFLQGTIFNKERFIQR